MTEAESDWYSEGTATFGDRLAGAREHAGLSQTDLALQVGVELSTIQAWEDDLREPRANRLQMLTGLLGVSVGWLLTGEGEGPVGPDGDPLPEDTHAILDEMRTLRVQMAAIASRMAVLDKRLRAVLGL